MSLEDAVREHEKGNHEGAIKKIEKVIPQLSQPLERIAAYCLWGYCLEDQEEYSQAKEKYITALLVILGRKPDTLPLATVNLPQGFPPPSLSDKASYANGNLSWRGVMSEEEMDTLLGVQEQVSAPDREVFKRAVKDLYRRSQREFISFLTDRFTNLAGKHDWDFVVRAAEVFNACGDILDKEGNIEAKEQYKRAKELCGRVIGESNDASVKAEAYRRRGYALMRLKDYEGSEESYKEAIRLLDGQPKGLVRAYNHLGNLYYCKGSFDKAREMYEKAVEETSEALTTEGILSRCSTPLRGKIRHTGRELIFKGAMKEEERNELLGLSQKEEERNKLLGLSQEDLNYYSEAVKRLFQKSHEIFVPPLNNLAYTLHKLGRYEKAEEWCMEARALGNVSAEFYDTLGCVYTGLGRYKEARDAFEMALEKKKKHAGIRNNYGEMLRFVGMHEKAKEQLNMAIELNRFFAITHSNLGDLYREQGKGIMAQDSYTTAISLDPSLPEARLGLADLYVSQAEEQGKGPALFYKALEEIERIPQSAGEWVERHPEFYLTRGYVYGKLTEYGKANEDFKKCMKQAKGNGKIASKAGLNLNALKGIEPDKVMKWGGIGLSILSLVILITVTVFYLGFNFKSDALIFPDKTVQKSAGAGGVSDVTKKTTSEEITKKRSTTKSTKQTQPDETESVEETTKTTQNVEASPKKEPGADSPKEKPRLIGSITYDVILGICLFFIAVGTSLPFIKTVKFKELQLDKETIAGVASRSTLVR